MKYLSLPLTSILITIISLTSCDSGTWSSSDRKACVNELLSSDDFTSEDMMGYAEESLNSVAECMCDVFESEFSTWKEASNILGDEEWAMGNPDAALELVGCFFSALSETEIEDAMDEALEDFDEELENLEEELEEELENLEEELEEAMEEFEDALEGVEF